jgi:hypothetical protein
MLPNLIIVGAAKSGTTSLHNYLDLHPAIEMSRIKELKLFTRDHWRADLDWYADQFGNAPIRGESSPTYSMHPYLASTAERIREVIPDVRLIYVLRDPVDRAVASYVEHVHLGFEHRSLTEALADAEDPSNPYTCPSRYGHQLKRFLDCFDATQVLVLDQTDLLEHRTETLARIFRFLEVDPAFHSSEFGQLHNTHVDKVRYNRAGLWMLRHRLFIRRRKFFRVGPIASPLRPLVSRPIDRSLPDADRSHLVRVLQPEVTQLRELTGEPWATWENFRA